MRKVSFARELLRPGRNMRTEISSVRELPGVHMMGHTCANLNGDLFFVWGGTNEQVAYLAARNTDLWIYETLTGYWRHRTCAGDCPPHLSSSASCLVGKKMFVFGGHSTKQDNWLNCLYCLDLETFVWRDLNGSNVSAQPTKPIRSDKNVCWSHQGQLYLFGGYGWSQTEHYLELLDRQPDLELAPDQRWPKFGWNNQLVTFDPSANAWDWPRYTGKCPSARAAHSGALMGEKYYVFGGRDCFQRLNDLYILDMRTLHWTQVNLATDCSAGQLIGPIQHLLEADDDDDNDADNRRDDHHHHHDDANVGVHEADAQIHNLDNQELVAEMRDVSSQALELDYLEASEDPSPSSSATAPAEPAPTTSGEGQLVAAAPLTPGQEEDEDDDYGEEYPYRSHLLERLSLSSASQQSTGGVSDQDCQSAGARESTATNPAAQSALFFSDNQSQQRAGQPQEAQAGGGGEPGDPGQLPPTTTTTRETTERFPMGRSFCSFTPLSEDRILLYGGVSSQDQKLDDCWLYDTNRNWWTQIDLKYKRPRLWHTGCKTRQNEVVIIGGSNSDKIDEFSSDVVVLSMEPKTLKRLALDAVSRSVRLRTIQKTRGIPSTICKLVRLRKQAMALTLARTTQH